MTIAAFEPVYLDAAPAKLTEHGKRFFDQQNSWVARFGDVWRDVVKLAEAQAERWDEVFERISAKQRLEFDPVMVSSGLAKYSMGKLIDHVNGKTSFTMPTTVALALGTSAPSSATTGVWGSPETTNYTGYGRVAIAGSGFNAATAADPSVATNNGAITFNACTASSATFLGFLVTDNSTINTGNALWYGSLTSVTISTTQTPPTVADTAMSLSLTGT